MGTFVPKIADYQLLSIAPCNVTYLLQKLSYPYGIGGPNELALGANIRAKDVQRLRWKNKDNPLGLK